MLMNFVDVGGLLYTPQVSPDSPQSRLGGIGLASPASKAALETHPTPRIQTDSAGSLRACCPAPNPCPGSRVQAANKDHLLCNHWGFGVMNSASGFVGLMGQV